MFRPGRVPGRTEVRWRLFLAVLINCGLWTWIVLTIRSFFA